MAPRRSSAVTNEPPGLLEGATFTLDAPPPVHIPAHELLQTELQNLPTGVSKPSSSCATSREACVLCVHAFWYCYCSLRQPGSNFEQHALLKMMSEQMARLTLLVAAQGEDRDSFFTAYPPVLAHAVLSAMRKHSLLTGAPQASSVLRHIIALFGCTLPSKQLARHLELVQQRMRAPSGAIVASAPPAPAPSAAADARATCPPLSSNAGAQALSSNSISPTAQMSLQSSPRPQMEK